MAPILQSKYSITDPNVFDKHTAMMEDFIRAMRLQGTFYEPAYDHDLSRFKTRDEEDDSPMPEREEEAKPQTIEDVWDNDFEPIEQDLSDFQWYPSQVLFPN